MIKLIRCDERLIHGQTMQYVMPENQIQAVYIIDDTIATNKILAMIYTKAVGSNIQCEVYSLQGFSEIAQGVIEDDQRSLIIMKYPRVANELFKKVSGLPQALNIGAQVGATAKEKITKIPGADYVMMRETDFEAVKEMDSNGIRVYFNAAGSISSTVEYASVKKDLL